MLVDAGDLGAGEILRSALHQPFGKFGHHLRMLGGVSQRTIRVFHGGAIQHPQLAHPADIYAGKGSIGYLAEQVAKERVDIGNPVVDFKILQSEHTTPARLTVRPRFPHLPVDHLKDLVNGGVTPMGDPIPAHLFLAHPRFEERCGVDLIQILVQAEAADSLFLKGFPTGQHNEIRRGGMPVPQLDDLSGVIGCHPLASHIVYGVILGHNLAINEDEHLRQRGELSHSLQIHHLLRIGYPQAVE